ncbi:hypothetical protein VN12_26410 [Pirellula sp. SH-Sr6A]|uniref:hypothetical protein n=1 Tax=Pirellula sp. SH-Sr6A TaxID=1632865 RepID=UPI00078ECC81|nr:hypothetical protein [Pirellula sp. SH-Sr6A]AMV35653.1 hypothetical protein VN12_26410 [Pirellula sp. SH-Sr6A]
MSTVEMKSVGPITNIVFDLPEGGGGVKILKGTSGTGKTTAIRALSGLLGDKDSLAGLTPHDGESAGEVTGLGRSVKIGKRSTTSGSVAVPTLGGRLDIATLVEPKVADSAARQKARVRCLISIGGNKLTPADLLGDRFDEFKTEIDIDDIASADDPVTMADKLKRALDSFALEQERAAERLAGMATAKRQEAGDVDQLQGALGYQKALENSRKASSELQAAELQATRFRSVSEANARIEEQIQEAEASGVVYQEDLESNIANARTTVEGLRRRLEAAERQLQSLLQQQKHAIEKQQMLDRLRSQIADPGESPSEERLAELRANELKAIELLNVAATVGQRKGALKESMSLQNESVDVANRAIDIRKFAQEVIGRAQKALPEGPIQIKDGLLVVRHEGRKKEVPFEELSTGQKWRVALQYAVRSVGKGGVIPLCQEAWQSLGPELKQEIAEICRESGVYLISASVEDGGELRVEDFE